MIDAPDRADNGLIRSPEQKVFDMPPRSHRRSGLGFLLALGLSAALTGCISAPSGPDLDTAVIDPNAGSEANLASLTAVIQANPGDASAYNVRGTALGQAGRLQEALTDFTAAVQLNPQFHQAYNNRALVYRRLGQNQAALADYNTAIQLNPSYSSAYLGRGTLYRQSGQFDYALADFNRAITLNTSDARGYYNRALIYQAQNDHVRAMADLDVSIALDPNASEPYNARGLSHLAQSENKKALADFILAVNRNKRSAVFWTNLGVAQIRTGDVSNGRNSLTRATVLDPSYQPAKDALRNEGTRV